jgi:hypothetical protein
LDHIAICEQGVWDKGGEPAGVISANKGVLNMSDKETRADAEPDKLDKVVSMLDSLSKRMDAMESKKDSTEVRKDAKRMSRKTPRRMATILMAPKRKKVPTKKKLATPKRMKTTRLAKMPCRMIPL